MTDLFPEVVRCLHETPRETQEELFQHCLKKVAEVLSDNFSKHALPLADQADSIHTDYDAAGAAVEMLNAIWILSLSNIAVRYSYKHDPERFVDIARQILCYKMEEVWPLNK